jgi:hypothetical protein
LRGDTGEFHKVGKWTAPFLLGRKEKCFGRSRTLRLKENQLTLAICFGKERNGSCTIAALEALMSFATFFILHSQKILGSDIYGNNREGMKRPLET